MPTSPNLLLASTSPRRSEILSALNLDFSVVHVDVDETPLATETPGEMVLRLAVAKAALSRSEPRTSPWVPIPPWSSMDRRSANRPMKRMAWLCCLRSPGAVIWLSRVWLCVGGMVPAPHFRKPKSDFREISRDEALAYWQSGEPCDKAGAYAIQGLGGAFVERIKGSYSGVVGLPVFETAALLREAGLEVVT